MNKKRRAAILKHRLKKKKLEEKRKAAGRAAEKAIDYVKQVYLLTGQPGTGKAIVRDELHIRLECSMLLR